MRRVLVALLLLTACPGESADPTADPYAKQMLLTQRPVPKFRTDAILRERNGSGRVAYLGFDVTPNSGIRAGDSVELRHYFAVTADFAGDYAVFVHGETPGGPRLLAADHHPIDGRVPTSRWKAGQIWADVHRIHIPAGAQGPRLDLWIGLFAGESRLTVQAPPGGQDGRNRIRAGSIPLDGGGADDLPTVTIASTTATITADGKLDEAAWATAPILSLTDTMGRNVPTRFPTKVRLLYDARNLYVSFEAVDRDVSCPYEKRDDPTYDHEAVELFIMPNVVAPGLGPYVELQASPKGIIFDAAFIARRKGMDTSFNAAQTVGTTIDGTLNIDDDADKGFVSEWVVPWMSLRGVRVPPRPGDEWRMNAFRIEKYRQGGKLAGEYTAWSPPRVGDFHNVERFGRMKFGP